MDCIILDASVAAKWYFEEDLKKEADSILFRFDQNKISIVVPEIFYLEMASICRKRVRKGLLKIEDALKTFDEIMELPVEKYSDQELADVAFQNALQYEISVYDALYVSVAEIYIAPFITADRDLLNHCKERFEFIEYLGDIQF